MASTGNQPVTSNNEEDFALQLTGASLFPMVFQAALELDVLEIIARAGPDAHLSSSEIASQLPTQHPNTPFMLDRILKLLASYSVVTCSLITLDNGQVQRTYGLAPVCKYFVRNQDGVSLVPLLLLSQDKVFIDTWHHLKDAVLEGGIPFNKVYGVNAFDYFSKDPRCNQVFNKAMFDYTSITMKKLLKTYKGFKELKELVDVGGGFGVTLHMITSEYPTIKGINFDLPHVIENAPSYPGVEHVGGDMFVSVPIADVIFLKWILHNWSDDQCLKLLKNCYEAIPDFGKVIVVDAVLPEAPETNDAAKGVYQLDLIMMARYPGGKERTEKEFEALAKGAGFTSIKLVCCFFNYWVMEFYKV